MRGKKVSPTDFRITPPEPGKVVRIVRFHVDGSDVQVECFAETTFECCPANAVNRLCSHVNKAITMLLQSDSKYPHGLA